MLLAQSLLSISIAAISCLLGVLAWREARRFRSMQFLSALCFSVAAGILWTLPEPLAMPNQAYWLLRALSIPASALMYCFVRSLLDDHYRFSNIDALIVVAVSIFPALYFIETLGVSMPFLRVASDYGAIPPLCMILYLLWGIVSGYQDDLVDPRRRFRRWLIAIILLSATVSLFSEDIPDARLGGMVRLLGVLPSGLLLCFWLLRVQTDHLRFREIIQLTDGRDDARDLISDPQTNIDPKDQSLLTRLQELMQEQRVFLQTELSVGSLAQQLKVPEHQLRALINRGLGYRNFSSYLAEARVAHAKALLADPDKARVQVLSIAMDSGFASLATFNRIFKGLVGVTPSDYRQQQLEIRLKEGLPQPEQ